LQKIKTGAIDIGNSRLKILAAGKSAAFDYKPGWESEALAFFQGITTGSLNVGYSSVSSIRLLNLKDALSQEKRIKLIDAYELLKSQSIIDFTGVSGIGADRLFGLIGAMTFSPPPLITIDCGTAITVNAVDSSARCLGGTISAGINTQSEALNRFTAALPEVKIQYEEKATGRDTYHAIRSGVILSVAGGIKEIVRRIMNEEFCCRQVPVYITGGSAEIILKAMREWIVFPVHRPFLVLEGISRLVIKV
jgi:pantothenate kinase type III